jgi:hypothetical protein
MTTGKSSSLKTHELVAPQFLDPRWMSFFRGGPQSGVVTEAGAVTVQGQELPFKEGAHGLPPGTPVKVWVDFHFVCASAADIEAREQDRKARAEQETIRHREELARMHAEGLAFNRTLRIPVKWHPDIKDVLSGLSETSDGSGRNRATVLHIRLREDLHDGRLHRSAGDMLCTSKSQNNGRNWYGHAYQESGRVTCTRCLALAKKWQEAETPTTEPAREAVTTQQPHTGDVLNLIGADGVIVGSIAEHGHSEKDVDVVVRDLGTETESVLQRVLRVYRPSCESSAVGHLWVNARPLPVELFGNCAWSTDDEEKDAKRLTFNQARKRSAPQEVYGAIMQVLRPPR